MLEIKLHSNVGISSNQVVKINFEVPKDMLWNRFSYILDQFKILTGSFIYTGTSPDQDLRQHQVNLIC